MQACSTLLPSQAKRRLQSTSNTSSDATSPLREAMAPSAGEIAVQTICHNSPFSRIRIWKNKRMNKQKHHHQQQKHTRIKALVCFWFQLFASYAGLSAQALHSSVLSCHSTEDIQCDVKSWIRLLSSVLLSTFTHDMHTPDAVPGLLPPSP